MKEVLSSVEIFFLKAIGKIPFWFLYKISDITYFLIFHVIGYRKKVVFENLTNSFPEKSKKEINLIARKYYHHLADLIFESVKLYNMTDEEIALACASHAGEECHTNVVKNFLNKIIKQD